LRFILLERGCVEVRVLLYVIDLLADVRKQVRQCWLKKEPGSGTYYQYQANNDQNCDEIGLATIGHCLASRYQPSKFVYHSISFLLA